MTLITYQTSGGEGGRCDAKCYSATTGNCRCICGGINHGCGKSQAIEHTQEMADQWIEMYQRDHPGSEVILSDAVKQLSLFRAREMQG